MLRIALPAEIDESTNRARGVPRQIAPNNDIDAVKVWLARFLDKQTTFDHYLKEAERLLLWSTLRQYSSWETWLRSAPWTKSSYCLME